MPKIIRSYFDKDLFTDSGALPCPRCRNRHPRVESHPSTGQMVTCNECGARGSLDDWNEKGEFSLERVKGKTHFYCDGIKKFKRPKSDVIEIATREELKE